MRAVSSVQEKEAADAREEPPLGKKSSKLGVFRVLIRLRQACVHLYLLPSDMRRSEAKPGPAEAEEGSQPKGKPKLTLSTKFKRVLRIIQVFYQVPASKPRCESEVTDISYIRLSAQPRSEAALILLKCIIPVETYFTFFESMPIQSVSVVQTGLTSCISHRYNIFQPDLAAFAVLTQMCNMLLSGCKLQHSSFVPSHSQKVSSLALEASYEHKVAPAGGTSAARRASEGDCVQCICEGATSPC